MNLVLTTDKSGALISGNIFSFHPGDKKKKNITPQSIVELIKSRRFIEDGTMRILNLTGTWLRQFEIKDMKIVAYGLVQAKKNTDGKATNANCIAWYLVTTYYFSDGTSTSTETFLGITCPENGAATYENLPPPQDGGGGGSIEMKTVEEEGSEGVSAGDGSSGPSLSVLSNMPSQVSVRYKFKMHFAYDYWGIVKELYYVEIFNAELIQSTYYFLTDNFSPAMLYVDLTGHVNRYVLLTNVSCLVEWTYNLNAGMQAEDGSSWYETYKKVHTRVAAG